MVASQPARQRKARLNQRCFCRSARFRDKRPRAGSATFSTPRASASLSFLAEKKSAISRSHLRKVPKASLMLVECRHPGLGVCRIALQNFITAHEAMLHFVEAHQPAKLVRLMRFPFADHLRMRFEQTQHFALYVRKIGRAHV